ncbi:MAG: hypothetical protein QG601_2510, partial [Pseudomonadota bacterium]|nr:hypothetical protein [Pseudomonadota bacterium]
MSAQKIDKKIVKYRVVKPGEKAEAEAKAKSEAKREALQAEARDDAKVIRMHERLERPEMLIGSTYKIKTPVSDHAM